jgi:O-antigen ligase
MSMQRTPPYAGYEMVRHRDTPYFAPGLHGGLTALYLLSGRWDLSRLSDASADATPSIAPFYTEVRFWVVLLLAVSSMLLSVGASTERRTRVRLVILPLVAFLAYLVLTVAWAPGTALGLHKAYELVLVGVASVSIGRILSGGNSGHAIRWMWGTVLLTSGVLAAVALKTLVASSGIGDRLAVLGGGPNVFARIMGYLALAALYFWRRHGLEWMFMPFIAVSLVLVLLSGSRGGLVALLAALTTFVVLDVRILGRLLLGVLIVGGVFLLVAMYTDIGRAAIDAYDMRIQGLLLHEQYTAGRTDLYRSAYQLGLAAPLLGQGLAAFPARGLGVYPHNLFLEAFAEGGMVGLSLLCLTLGAGAVAMFRLRARPDGAAVGGFVLMLVASQFSGDLYDSRAVFAFLVAASAGRAMAALPASSRAASRSNVPTIEHMVPVIRRPEP